jgi:predicted transcriptional regulator
MAKKRASRRPPQASAPTVAASQTELEVLKALWRLGRATVREVHGQLDRRGRGWAYTTVLTLLQRLQTKGYVATKKEGVAHVYEPIVSRQRVLGHRLAELAEQLAEGSASSLVQALVENNRFSEEDIEHFRALLDQLEEETKGDPPGTKKKRRQT